MLGRLWILQRRLLQVDLDLGLGPGVIWFGGHLCLCCVKVVDVEQVLENEYDGSKERCFDDQKLGFCSGEDCASQKELKDGC